MNKKRKKKTSGTRQKRARYSRAMHRIHYWLTLLVLTICSFLITLVLVPFVLVLSSLTVYLLVILLGLVFGLIFTFIIVDLEYLEKHHHIFAGVFIPLVALINMMLLMMVSSRIGAVFDIQVRIDPVMVSIIYLASFVLPYLCHKFAGHVQAKKR